MEETYEVLAAIDANDDANLREELGDLLLHVVMHAQMGSERGAFDFDAVASEIGDKMIRRHPHVFGEDRRGNDSAAILKRWEEIKREEKKGANDGGAEPVSIMAGLLDALPALLRAQKAQEKAARVGFDWPTVAEVAAKVREEIAEVEAETVSGPGHNAEPWPTRSATCSLRPSTWRAGTSSKPKTSSNARRTSSCGVSATSRRRSNPPAAAGKTRPSTNWTPSGNRPRNRSLSPRFDERNPVGMVYITEPKR